MYPTTINWSLFNFISLLHVFWSFYYIHIHLGLIYPSSSNLNFMCLCVVLFILLLELCWASWTCVFRVFIKLRKFSTLISSNFFFCHPPFWHSSYTYVRLTDIVLQITDSLFIYFRLFCLTSGSFYQYCLQNHWSFFSIESNLLLLLPRVFFI